MTTARAPKRGRGNMEQDKRTNDNQPAHESSANEGTPEVTPAKSVSAVGAKSTDCVLATTSEQETTSPHEGGAHTADREEPSISESKPRRASTDPTARLGKVRTSISAQGCGSPVVDAVALKTVATSGEVTPDISGNSTSRSSLASTESSAEMQKKGKQLRRSGKKRRKRRQEGGRDIVVVTNRTNILRDPFYVCVGRPFPNEEEQTAAEENKGFDADKVVAYVTSTSVDGSASAAIEKAVRQAELVKEKAVLDAVLRDLIDLLELHSVRQEKPEAEAEQPNGLIGPRFEKQGDHFSKRENVSSNLADTCQNESEANHPDGIVVDAGLAQSEQLSSIKKQAVREEHPPQCLVANGEVRQHPANSSQANQDHTSGSNQRPESSGATTASESRRVALHEHTLDVASATLKVYEAPLIFFSMSLTESSERNQPAPSKDSSGYLGGSETEPVRSKPDEDDHGFLDMAFGAGSFTNHCGLGQMPPDGENASSPTALGGGCTPGCWNNFLQPITMVSKYIQTDCWNNPASESSFSDVVRQTSHHKSSTKILQRPCSMQISVPQRRAAAGGGTNYSSAEELEKIFAAYSPPSTPGGKDFSGRADMKKGMLRDRNFILPSSAEGGADTAPPSTPAAVVRQRALDGGSKAVAAAVEESPAE